MNLESLRRTSTAIGRVELVFAVTALSISTLMSFAGVVCRYVLEVEAWWVFPIQQYTYITLVFTGAAIAARKRIHVRVEVFDVLLSKRPKAQHWLNLSTRVIAVIAAILFTVLAFRFMLRMWHTPQYDVVLQWFNLAWVKSLPFVMGLLFCGYFGAALADGFRKRGASPNEKGGQND